MKVAFFNDTGNFPHIGCLAVSNAHNKLLEKLGANVHYRFFVNELHGLWTGNRLQSAKLIEESFLNDVIDNCDAIIVNGEGTIHHGAGMHLLTILAFAQKRGKPTYLINAVVQEVTEYLDTLQNLSDLTVRELHSSNYLSSLGINHRVVPDSIIHAEFNVAQELALKKKLYYTDCHHLRTDVRRSLDEFSHAFHSTYFPLEHKGAFTSWKNSVAALKDACLVVTGRFHAVYLCALARAPFIALPSNTWKIEGTLALFNQATGNSLAIFEKPQITQADIEQALDNRELYLDFSEFILAQRAHSPLERLQG